MDTTRVHATTHREQLLCWAVAALCVILAVFYAFEGAVLATIIFAVIAVAMYWVGGRRDPL